MKPAPVALLLLAACAAETPPPPTPAPRPITVLQLAETDPIGPLLLTGSANTWKEEDVAFEVEGRVEFIVEQGTNLAGRWLEDGEVRAQGDVLARLDTRELRIARDQAEAALEVTRARLETARVELDKVLPALERAALAERDRAQAEFERFERALEEKSVSELDVIRSRADRDARQASYEEALANRDRKESEIKSLEADIKRAEEDLALAEYDVERCTLYAPFDAEISDVLVEAGGYARRGGAVAHIVMMNPLKIDLAVSPTTAARLRLGDTVRIERPGGELGYARVYDKATAADVETRTFRVSLLTENNRARLEFPPDDPRSAMPRIELTMGLVGDPDGRFFVEGNRTLREDQDGFFVWSDPDRGARDSAPEDHVLNLRKYRVTPGDQYRNFQGLYLMRDLAEVGELDRGDLVALDVPPDFEGGPVVLDRPDWELRPGELVPVYLETDPPAPGLYLPMSAVRPTGEGRGLVFLAADGKAKEVEARLVGQVGDQVRVEGEGLRAGVDVILDQIHFLQNGEPVRVVSRRGSDQ